MRFVNAASSNTRKFSNDLVLPCYSVIDTTNIFSQFNTTFPHLFVFHVISGVSVKLTILMSIIYYHSPLHSCSSSKLYSCSLPLISSHFPKLPSLIFISTYSSFPAPVVYYYFHGCIFFIMLVKQEQSSITIYQLLQLMQLFTIVIDMITRSKFQSDFLKSSKSSIICCNKKS